jgi:hypothetical protein
MLSINQKEVLNYLKAKNQIKAISYDSEKSILKINIGQFEPVTMNVSKSDSLLIINQYTKK